MYIVVKHGSVLYWAAILLLALGQAIEKEQKKHTLLRPQQNSTCPLTSWTYFVRVMLFRV